MEKHRLQELAGITTAKASLDVTQAQLEKAIWKEVKFLHHNGWAKTTARDVIAEQLADIIKELKSK